MKRRTFILVAAALGCTFAQAQNTKELNAVYFAEPVFEQVSFGSDDAQLLKMETPEGGVVFDAKEFAQALTPMQEEAIGEQFEMKAILDTATPIQEEAIGEQFEMKAILDAATPIQEEAIGEQFEIKAILDASTPIQEEAISEQFEMKAILDAVKDTPALAIIIRNRELLISDCSNNAIIDRYELSNVEERESKTILTTAGGDEFVLETTADGRFLTKTKGKPNLPFDKMRIIR
ncbi:MAG: hypothetical protein SPL14_04935 [Candidatus Onthomorpha sp.]|nr:hypothetical protein [Bacteroidales bacterium]MDY5698758.1 hypothetical protein [Candidatus Onthomorpha sp.]